MVLISRLADFDWGTQALKDLQSFDPYFLKGTKSVKANKSDTIWLVIPYHPVWVAAGISRSIHVHLADPAWRDALGEVFGAKSAFDIRICWSLPSRHFVHKLRYQHK